LTAATLGKGRDFDELNLTFLDDQEDEHSPRFPSGIVELDNLTGGGFFGFSACAGRKKLGKTMIAVRSAVEAARTGWNVHYTYGENTAARVRSLVKKVLGPLAEDPPDWFYSNLRGFRFGDGARVDGLVENVTERIPDDAEKVLVVVDSVNRLARYSGSDYLRTLNRICQVAQNSSEVSGGRVAWLVLSELNQRGGMVGMDLEYSAACLLYMRRTKDPDHVKFSVDSRESPGGDLGKLYRNWAQCTFENPAGPPEREEPEAATTPVQQKLTLVAGGREWDVPFPI
jgi:hypothetical protein